jgi:two-component system cell cycle sensor histidine kinase/response regulator CckA
VRRRKDGGEIAVDVTISPIRDALGRIVGASTIARDITDRKRVQEKLLHAQKMESLGVLAGGVAHDFNNILMAIIANVTLVLDDADSPIASLADNVMIATEQAAHLTNQMLAYSGKGKFTVEPLSLTRQIQELPRYFACLSPRVWICGWTLIQASQRLTPTPARSNIWSRPWS